MSSNHVDYNEDSYASGVENIVEQTHWSIHFSHVPTSRCVFFEAFLTNFEDSFSSTWSKDNVFGRMDPIATYQNTERQINFGFKVLAESPIAAAKNVHRFQHLSTFLYPTYEELQSPNQLVKGSERLLTMNQSPLIRIKFANLIQDASTIGNGTAAKPAPQTRNPNEAGLVGYVQGFNFTPKLESGFFSGGPGVFYPVEYEVNVAFTVLHNHNLGWSQNGWLGPRSFPNGDGTLGINKTTPKECEPKSKYLDSPTGNAVNPTAEPEKKTVKSRQTKAEEKKVLNGMKGR